MLVEALNPKTAAFFLAFVPQFMNPAAGSVAIQFVVLGTISVALNTLVDVVVAYGASGIRQAQQRGRGWSVASVKGRAR